MSTAHTTIATNPDPLSQALAEAILARLNLDHLAQRIADHLRSDTPAASPEYDPNTPYPVTLIRKELGRRGRPMAHMTFQRNYIETGLLTLIPGPNRRQLYVRAGDWHRLKTQTTTR